MGEPGWWDPATDGAGVVVRVRVTPGARRSEVQGVHGGRLRLRVAAPPVEGKANQAVARYLAELFGVRASAVTLLRGERARDKDLLVIGPARPPASLPDG